ncbi:unnamed protein product [Ilex paraguariensis]|uniref:Uncharacterized protein n=1 Tax=Ilex paraguariensis TaxID=185542 RepID=A0ABC8S343_9AQUA
MGSFGDDDKEYRFFDACENIAPVSDLGSDYADCPDSSSGIDNGVSSSFQYDVWIRSPRSVQERRGKFFRWFGLDCDSNAADSLLDVYGDLFKRDMDRIMDNSGAVLRTSIFEDKLSSRQSSVSSWSNDVLDSSRELSSNEKFVCRSTNSNGGMELILDKLGHDSKLSKAQVAVVNQLETAEGFVSTSGSSCSAQKVVEREIGDDSNVSRARNRVKNWWLSRLRSMMCVVDNQGKAGDSSDLIQEPRVQRMQVRHRKKRLKEISALFTGQDIQAHQGSILTMKFSLDGQFLASAGEDGIVRVWQIVEDERSNEIDIPEIDPSCIYFALNTLSELAPIMVEKEKINKLKSIRKTSDPACVIFPPKVFRILEKPLHEFHGHSAEILDLSWSTDNCLISSSIDKTVRLWRVGCDQCLKVFSHSNYVTCVQFNPVDDNHFISGSIDGKVRIWAINSCQVVDWTDIRDIVTAICYRPDGQGGIIGSMTGICRFFSLSDNHFQLEALVCLDSKKKSPCKRIIGLQFFPRDSSKAMVTCADSQIRILHGINVIRKYRGLRNAGNQISTFFTSDGKHIVSACEDSNIYVWNCVSQEEFSLSQPKTIRSFECFPMDASVALPWSGLKLGNSDHGLQSGFLDESALNTLPFSSSACFSLGQECFLESIPKGSATWPEEKLPSSSSQAFSSAIRKSQYKFLKTSCQSSSNSHAWGLVIVTAGWDGRIRSFHNYGLPVPL